MDKSEDFYTRMESDFKEEIENINEIKVTYVSNAGILIESDSKKIMIDGICSGGEVYLR